MAPLPNLGTRLSSTGLEPAGASLLDCYGLGSARPYTALTLRDVTPGF